MIQSSSPMEHIRLIKRAVGLPCSQLKDDFARQLMVSSVRTGVLVIDQHPLTVRRAYVTTETSNRLADVGWVLHEGIPCCLSCHMKFTMFTRRHHCRACGSLLCSQCSTHAMIIGFPTMHTQIVCKLCNPECANEVRLRDLTKWGKLIYKTPGGLPRKPSDAEFATIAHNEVIASPNSIEAVATPGYVIKTKRTSLPNVKIFIKVFHCNAVKDSYLMLTYVPPRPEAEDTVTIPNLSLRLPANESNSQLPPPGNNSFRSVSLADTPRTAGSGSRYASLSDKPRAHAYSNYQSYVRLKANGSPENSNFSGSPHSTTSHRNNANNMQTRGISPDGITSKESFSPDTDNNHVQTNNVYLQVTPLVYVGTTSTAQDKVGGAAMVYNVLISSDYFRSVIVNNTQYSSAAFGARALVTNPIAVNKIIQVINQHYQHDLQENYYILPKIRQSFKGSISPISKPVLYSRTLCSVKCIPESECVCTVEPQRSGSVCSDLSGSVYTMLGATSPNTLPEPPTVTNTVAIPPQQQLTQSAPAFHSSKKTETSSNKTDATTTQQNALTTITNLHNENNENNEKPTHNKRRDSTCSTTSTSTHTHPHAHSDWYSKSRTFTSVYFRQFVHSSSTSRNLCAEITSEMMQLKPQLCLSVQESEELKQKSVHDPTVLLGYQIICPYSAQSGQVLIADQSLIYIITDLRRNSQFHTEYKLSQFGLAEKGKWERLRRSEKKLGFEFRITFQSIIL